MCLYVYLGAPYVTMKDLRITQNLLEGLARDFLSYKIPKDQVESYLYGLSRNHPGRHLGAYPSYGILRMLH
jgi:hypothetical protein